MKLLSRAWAWLRTRWAWLVVAVAAVWWALAERRGRQRAEARADLEKDLVTVRLEQSGAEVRARTKATDQRADIEVERARHEVKARVDIVAAEVAIERAKAELAETGRVTAEAQTVFDAMKKSGRLP